MLRINERLTITGVSVVGETVVCTFTALFNDLNQPENASIYQTKNEPEMYKENRAAYRADYAEFEDYVYERQAEMVKAKGEAG